jgi:glycosyltransferase involved in cell wall biosynthesis
MTLPASPVSVSPSSPSRPRIVYIGYVGGLGGEGNQMFELATGAARHGWDATIVVPDMPGNRRMAEAHQGIANLRVVLTDLIKFNQPSQNPLDVLKLHTQHRAPVVHLHTGDICVPRVNLLALELLRGFSVFATIHSAYPDMAVGSPRAKYWASSVRRRFTQVICPSKHGRDTQLGYGLPPERVMTVYNGVDTARFAGGDASVARRALQVGPDVPLIVATARLHDQKRPVDCVHAFARIAPEFPQARLVLVGSGPLEGEVRTAVANAQLTERVDLVGHQTNVPDWLQASDVWLCTSDAENFSLSVLEAMSAGCAVVSTNCRGNDEVLQNEVNALTASVGNVEELAHGLRRVLADANLREHLKRGAKETAKHFDRSQMVSRHMELYTACLRAS